MTPSVLPGHAMKWTYIVERRSPNGWVAVGDMRLYEGTTWRGLCPHADISTVAFLSGLRMDAMNACSNRECDMLHSTQPWPEDASAWARASLATVSKRFKRPLAGICGKEYTGKGPSLKRVQAWLQAFHTDTGLPFILPETVDKLEPIISVFMDLRDQRAAHTRMAEHVILNTLTDTRLLLLQTKRGDGFF